MIVYGILVGLTILTYFIMSSVVRNKDKINKVTTIFFFLGYLLLLCLRSESIGVDTKWYVQSFNMMRRMDFQTMLVFSNTEVGFLALEKLIAFFGDTRLMMVVVAMLVVLPVMYLYEKESRDALLCCSFFLISLLFEMFFSGMRQSIAIALAVPAYYFAKQQKKLLFVLTVLIAMTFHKSAVVVLLLYPVYHMKITKKILLVIFPLLLFMYLHIDTVFQYIIRFAGDDYESRYAYLTGSSGQMGLTILFILLTVYSYIMMDEKKADSDDLGLRNILFLAMCIHLFAPLHPTISRVNYYFILFIPLALSRANFCCRKSMLQIKAIAAFVMPVYFILHFFFLKADSLQVFNYKFFF